MTSPCKRQQHAAEEAISNNKHQQASTSRSAADPALLGTRWNQRHNDEKIALSSFVVLFVHDQVEQQK